jgi:predicted permease
MAWAFQGVLNAGVQILLSIVRGWVCGRLRLVDPDALSASLNTFAMKSCFPAFVIHLLGIKADLQDAAAWRLVELEAVTVHPVNSSSRFQLYSRSNWTS